MEIGSFIDIQFPTGLEYRKEENTARLNSGRAAIYHAFRLTGCDAVWLPLYQCDTVRDFLKKKNVKVKYYSIDSTFTPVDLYPDENEAVLIVNYYGIMSADRMSFLASKYKNVIIDNSQAFFCEPLKNCYNVYSCRKFVGVPDGAYVAGENADRFTDEYEQCFSSDTSLFLLQRSEYGCEGKTYKSRTVNEERIDKEDILKMSSLTRKILDGTDYEYIKTKRRENFKYACEIFGNINKINPEMYYDSTCIPMVYPLVVEDDNLLTKLLENKHFQGHWWSYLLNEVPEESFEYYISRYIIPITIDQRYGKKELDFVRSLINE